MSLITRKKALWFFYKEHEIIVLFPFSKPCENMFLS